MSKERLEIGDYYRTFKGLIRKVETMNTPETRQEKHIGYVKRNVLLVNGRHTLEEIKIHSPNKIDLVEKGDYVNGYRVNSIEKEYYNAVLDEVIPKGETELIIGNEEGLLSIGANDIKTIVTHEQFKAMEYNF